MEDVHLQDQFEAGRRDYALTLGMYWRTMRGAGVPWPLASVAFCCFVASYEWPQRFEA